MATESPMRMVDGGEATKWSPSKDAAIYGSPLKNMAAEELGLLLKGHRFHGDKTDMVPNRSGSAPPSMEGSFAAIGNFLAQQSSNLDSNLENLSSAIENCESEEQLRSDPAYLAYYCSNVNLNPRLPPPLMSRENRRLVRHIGSIANWKPGSLDDMDNGLLQLSQSSLSTHKEEPDDDRSPSQSSENLVDDGDTSTGELKTFSLAGRHKSLVDLIQEDFPRTPSPVYQSRSSSHAPTEEPIDHDIHAISLDISSISISEEPELKLGSADVHGDNVELVSNKDSLKTTFSSSSCPDQSGSLPAPQKNGISTKSAVMEDEALVVCASTVSDISKIESRMRNKQGDPQSYMKSMLQNHPFAQQGTPYQVQGIQAPVISQAMSNSFGGMEKIVHSHPKSSTTEVRPLLPSSGPTPPYYATPAAYMTSGNPFYPNFQPPGLYTPQYGVGGYALGSAVLPSFMAGYHSQSAMPVPLDTNSGPGFDSQNMSVSTGENNLHVADMQHLGKFYGHHGMMLQPSFLDPLQMPYLQHNFGDVYNSPVPHGRLAASNVPGSQVDSFTSYMCEPKLQPPTGGNLGIPSPRRVGITGGGYYGVPPSMGVMTQFPGSPLGSPVLPSSPIGGTSYLGRRNEMRFPQGSSKNVGPYSGWQGQRGVNSFDDPKRHSFLEELKSSNARKFELSDIAGRIVEFSVDQHGSRFIQQKLENCSVEDKVSVFKEVLPHASKLMTDVFGNYVIQKFFEHGSPEQRRELADQLVGQMLPLSLQMYGCRVIQKALEVIELDQKTKLVHELDGHVMRCVRDQNGNHVIQKCIECLPTEKIGFIIVAFQGQVATLSTHPYGCRVIQRVLEHGSEELQSQCIVDEILESACVLAEDQYGNYVTQHVLERGKPHERSQIISKLTGKIVQMCQHKYASNVIEKCLEYGDTSDRELLIDEIVGQSEENDSLLTMMKDQFANYVVQKIFETGSDRQREILLNHVRVHLNALKKYTYGKHIVARFEQLFGEETEASET